MASPTIEATATSSETTAVTSHTVALPTGIVAGSGLRVTFAYTEGLPQTITWPAGWTPVTSFKHERTTVVGFDSAYRQADGGEGASITVTTSSLTKSAHIAKRYAGHESFATRAPEAGVGANNLSTDPNPPSITPTGGSKDYLFEAEAVTDGEDFTWTAPTSYTDQLTTNTGIGGASSTNCSVASARRALTAASEDPGVYTHVSAHWCAQTVAIHPAAGGTLFQRSFAGSVTPAGTLARKTKTTKTGSITAAGALTRKTRKTLTASITPTGALTKKISKTFLGSITPTGILTTLKIAAAVMRRLEGALGIGRQDGTATVNRQEGKLE